MVRVQSIMEPEPIIPEYTGVRSEEISMKFEPGRGLSQLNKTFL